MQQDHGAPNVSSEMGQESFLGSFNRVPSGLDPTQVYSHFLKMSGRIRQLEEQARQVSAPFLLEARTYRFRAHSMYDAELYRNKQEVEEWKKRDPIASFTKGLREQQIIMENDLSELEQEVAGEVSKAVAFAEAGPWEPVEDLTRDVYTSPDKPPWQR